MFGRVRGLMGQASATMAEANRLMDKGDRAMAKADAMMTAVNKIMVAMDADIGDLIKEVQDGVDFELVWQPFQPQPDGSTKLPLKLRITIKE